MRTSRSWTLGLLLLAGGVLTAPSLAAQAPSARPALVIPPGAAASANFTPATATDAYLATVPPDKKARSDAYFEGGYWIQLWDFLISIAVYGLFLASGLSAAMRDRAERLSRVRSLQVAAYWVPFLVIYSLVTLPWAIYVGFVREHQYQLATQTFPAWFSDQLKGFGVTLVVGSLLLMALYAVLRRAGRTWWLWATGVVLVFTTIGMVLAPVFIFPLFNSYTRLTDAQVREPVLSMARANGIPADDVFVVDQSRQTTRISANVSGLFGTMRISLNDNLLKRSSIEEIEAVLGHEMGHYVLNHMIKLIVGITLITGVGFAFVAAAFERVRIRRPGWRIGSVADVAGLPLIALLFSVYQFAATPANNTLIRSSEQEADMFGLNAAREPDGFAAAALQLGEYRKLSPGPIEEFVFFDHPSGRTRIFNAMRWKGEELRRQERRSQ